jgi:hypothetical protein
MIKGSFQQKSKYKRNNIHLTIEPKLHKSQTERSDGGKKKIQQ